MNILSIIVYPFIICLEIVGVVLLVEHWQEVKYDLRYMVGLEDEDEEPKQRC